MASVAESPVATTLAAPDHPAAVTRSENQYQVNDHPVQVCFSGGTGSWSAFVQTYEGATEDSCLGRRQLEKEVSRVFALDVAACRRWRAEAGFIFLHDFQESIRRDWKEGRKCSIQLITTTHLELIRERTKCHGSLIYAIYRHTDRRMKLIGILAKIARLPRGNYCAQ